MKSTARDKVKHHYVPQHYLNGFTEAPDSPYIWVYEKGSRNASKRTAKIIAFENHFYTVTNDDGTKDSNTIENFLANDVEGPANPIVDKIRDRQMITDNEKAVFTRYLVVTLKRVPRNRQRLTQEIGPKTIDSVANGIYEDLDTAIRENPDRAAFLRAKRQEAEQIIEQYRMQLPDSFIMNLLRRDSLRVMHALQSMTWRFLTFDEGQFFLTSDNPVFYFEGIGIGKPHSEVTVPISKTVALWATWRQDLEEGFFPTNARAVKEINCRSVRNATRYVYSPTKAGWLVTLVNKRRYELHQLL